MPVPMQQDLDPLPTPDINVEVTPANPRNPYGLLPPYAGWVPKSGAGAFVADQILTGWMAGRHMAQERKLSQAKQNVVGARDIYSQAAESYKNLVDQGLDPNKPEDAQRIDQAKKNVVYAWNHYLDIAGAYSKPDEKAGKQPKGSKVKKGLHDMFMGQDPQFFVDSSLQALRSQGPPVLTYGKSSEEQERLKQTHQQTKINEQILKQNEQSAALADEQAKARQNLLTAEKSGTPEEIAKARQAAADVGVVTQRVESAAEVQAAQDIAKLKSSGIGKLSEGKTTSDLTQGERAALGIQLGPYDTYLNEVGPGKRFKTSLDASKAFQRDQYAAAAFNRAPTNFEQMRRSEAVVLDHELRTVEGAKKYGLPAPLKPGEKVPQWLIEQVALQRTKPTGEERQAVKGGIQSQIHLAINTMLQRKGLDPKDKQYILDNFVQIDPQTGMYVMRQEPEETEEFKHFWSSDKQKMMGGLPEEEFKRRRDSFIAQISGNWAAKNKHVDAEVLAGALRTSDPAETLLQDRERQESQLEEPPSVPGTVQAGEREYTVSDGNATSVVTMTEEEAAILANNNPHFTVTPTRQK